MLSHGRCPLKPAVGLSGLVPGIVLEHAFFGLLSVGSRLLCFDALPYLPQELLQFRSQAQKFLRVRFALHPLAKLFQPRFLSIVQDAPFSELPARDRALTRFLADSLATGNRMPATAPCAYIPCRIAKMLPESLSSRARKMDRTANLPPLRPIALRETSKSTPVFLVVFRKKPS
jgi:hypothetical protein